MRVNTILAIALVFGALVFFHELGHFLLAKRAGILVREFAIGFGPRLVAFRRGETVYSLRLFPLGGYVRMAGEDPEMVSLAAGRQVHVRVNGQGQVTDIYLVPPEDVASAAPVTVQAADLERALTLTVEEPDGTVRRYPVHPQAHLHEKGRAVQIAPLDRQFGSKTLGQRFATIVAGPVANLILAVVLFFVFALMTPAVTGRPVVGDVEPNLPAAKAGLAPGDRILSVNGRAVNDWTDLLEAVRASEGKRLALVVERGGQRLDVTLKPEQRDGRWLVGIAPETRSRTLTEAAAYGVTQTWDLSAKIVTFLGLLVGKLFTGEGPEADLSGPVGIFLFTGAAAEQGLASLVHWAAFLSVNLAIFNLLPFPALDGGRLLFLGIEMLRGRPVDPEKESLVHFIGLAFLLLLIIVVTWNDIQNLDRLRDIVNS